MNARLLLLLTVALCLSAGCRRDPSVYIELLNAEKRALEDALYDLEYDYELLLEELEACRAELDEEVPAAGIPAPAGKRRALPPGVPGDIPELTPPSIESGVPMGAAVETELLPIEVESGRPTPAGDTAIEEELPRPTATSSQGQDAADDVDAEPVVPRIELDPLTRGADFDGRPGDDGLVVVLRPSGLKQSAAGDPQSIAVVALDPALDGEQARVGRWDLSSKQIASYRHGLDGNVVYKLKLPWPQNAPEHDRLHVFVRYVTLEGDLLEADREIAVLVAGATVGRWTPRLSNAASAIDIARRPTPQAEEAAEELGTLNDHSPSFPARDSVRPLTGADSSTAGQRPTTLPSGSTLEGRPRWTPFR